ncbi:helicase associated domain-containing protein [Leifsonia poae]|uniref:helicase associated domain-containing protein n=1 Tax=Leifsonia poae TaxID=110933 RepID=UPI003D697D43
MRPADLQWLDTYDELRHFLADHGRYPNATYASPVERRLRSWISTQRNAHAGIGTATLTAERAALLEDLPDWRW